MDLPEGRPDADAPLVGRARRPSLEGPGPQRQERVAIGGYLQPNLSGPEPGGEIETAIGEGYEPNFMNVPPTFEHAALKGLRSGIDLPTNPKLPGTYRPLVGARPLNRGNAKLVRLVPNAVGGQPAQEFSTILSAPRDAGDDGEAIIVTLGLDYPSPTKVVNGTSPSNADLFPFDVTALLRWGVGGAQFSAEIDWIQGTTFSLGASFLEIGARVGALPPLALDPLEFFLRASLAYGYAGSSKLLTPCKLTVLVPITPGTPGVLPAGSISDTIAIPPFATAFTVASITGGAGITPTLDVNILEAFAGTPTALYRYATRTNLGWQNEGAFPIPGKSRFLNVTNNGPLQQDGVKIIFNLAL